MNRINLSKLSYIILFAFLYMSSAYAEDIPDDYVYTPMIEEGKAWHYRVTNWRTHSKEDVKLVLQGDVEWENQLWKQCWFMTEENKPLAKTPVALLREENKIVYIYPIVNGSTFYDESGKYSWDHLQIQYCMTYFKNYCDVNTCDGYPIETPEEINEVYPAVLYDFNMKSGDSMARLASSHWARVALDEFSVDDLEYECNCSRIYKKLRLKEYWGNYSPSLYEGIGYVESLTDYGHETYFICPIPAFGEPTVFEGDAVLPAFLYVTDKDGNVLFKKIDSSSLQAGSIESDNIKLNFADGNLVLLGSSTESCSLVLYDMCGNTVYNGSISSDSPVCISDKLLPGIYIAVAEGHDSISRLKFEVK